MHSLLKILVDRRCRVYSDFKLKGEASPNSLFKIQLRRGTHILEFKIGDNVLTKEVTISTVNEDILLKISLDDMPTKKDYCIKVQGSQQCLYNTKHNKVVDLPYQEYKEIDGLEHQHAKAYITRLNNMWGAIKHNGKELIASQFKSFCKVLFDKYLCFEKSDNRYQIYSLQGDLLTTVSSFSELCGHINYLVFSNFHGHSAIIDDNLRPRTHFSYQQIVPFGEEGGHYFKVQQDGYWGVLELSATPAHNTMLLPCKFEEIDDSFAGFSVEQYVRVKYNNQYYLVDQYGKPKDEAQESHQGKGQLVFAKKYLLLDGLMRAKSHIW